MKRANTYPALVLLLLFCCYYSGISMFSHAHIVNGSSVFHSHLGGGSDHEHSESQYTVIDLLSQFQSESASEIIFSFTPFFVLSELFFGYETPALTGGAFPVMTLRGPPSVD